MEKLLQWSIASQNGDKETMERVGTPDPEIIAQLFGMGGPDEPTLMKQAMEIISSPDTSLESKEIAFENFEMLIENLDNANNIGNMKMWGGIINQLKAEESLMRKYACSVIGTATQNNEKSQKDLLKHENVFGDLITVYNEGDEALKLKCLYALSNFLRHNPDGYGLFKKYGGWGFVQLVNKEVEESKSEKLAVRLNSLMLSILSSGKSKDKLKQMEGIFDAEQVKKYMDSYQ